VGERIREEGVLLRIHQRSNGEAGHAAVVLQRPALGPEAPLVEKAKRDIDIDLKAAMAVKRSAALLSEVNVFRLKDSHSNGAFDYR
jgi:hypothetical protein